jgi:hypothetical protein
MNGLMMLEQQLAAVVSAPVSLPLGLAASACAALVVAALLLQSIVLRQRRTKPIQSQRKTEDHAAAMVTAAANAFHAANGKEDVQGGIPSADRLFQLISTRRSVFPKVAVVALHGTAVPSEYFCNKRLCLSHDRCRRILTANSSRTVICRCVRPPRCVRQHEASDKCYY